MEERISVIITDDKQKYRDAIKGMLTALPVDIIGEAENGKELLLLLNEKKPDIVMLDLEMPVMDGNQAFDTMTKRFPGTKVIILSFYFENILMDDYLARGVKGYIPKDALEPGILQEALRVIMAGGTFMYQKPEKDRLIFSRRQKEIMPLILDGFTSDEIAEEVRINKRSVEKLRQKIYRKSGAIKVVDFYKYAFTRGLQFLGKRIRYRSNN